MKTIMVELSPQTAKLFWEKKVVSENWFLDTLQKDFENTLSVKEMFNNLGIELENEEIYFPVDMKAEDVLMTLQNEVLASKK